MPLVSVIIPCYNDGHYLDDSVASARQQTFGDIEIIIVNDGSTDTGTIEKLASFNDHDNGAIRQAFIFSPIMVSDMQKDSSL
jgi:glycosyltransferase involved in cell wall biosynthesis